MEKRYCECGCGEEIIPKRKHKYTGPPRFASGGHWTRWNAIHGSGATRPKRVPDRIPSGICECGCGGETRIAQSTSYVTGSVKGYPNRFIQGHHSKRHARGEHATAWRGGKQFQRDGYVKVLTPGHPNGDRDGYVPEHRLVMEGHLGRYLTTNESVHHRNGMRGDNRIENLELWARKRHPNGQRVEDLFAFALEVIDTYGHEIELISGVRAQAI